MRAGSSSFALVPPKIPASTHQPFSPWSSKSVPQRPADVVFQFDLRVLLHTHLDCGSRSGSGSPQNDWAGFLPPSIQAGKSRASHPLIQRPQPGWPGAVFEHMAQIGPLQRPQWTEVRTIPKCAVGAGFRRPVSAGRPDSGSPRSRCRTWWPRWNNICDHSPAHRNAPLRCSLIQRARALRARSRAAAIRETVQG